MHIAVADDRLAVRTRPIYRAVVEVQLAREHRVVLDRVEEVGMAIERAPEAGGRRIEGVRRDDQAGLGGFQARQVGERADPFCGGAEVDQEHMFALNRPLDPWNEDDPAVRREGLDVVKTQLSFMERDGHRAKPLRGGAGNQLGG